MLKLLLGTILLFQCHIFLAQEKQLPFTLEGNINADTGVVALHLFYDQDYYPAGVEKLVAEVKNNHFSFNGYIPYPQGFTLSYGEHYISRLFVIEPGHQSVTVDINVSREVPVIDNQSMSEYTGEYAAAFERVNSKRKLYNAKRDSLKQFYQNKIPDSIQLVLEQEIKDIYVESDSNLLHYVSVHPNSYIAFWKFIELFSFDGHNQIFDAILARFSDSLKNTFAGKVLTEKLATSGMLAMGKPFPSFTVIDVKNNPINENLFSENKYTFVDFWYSNCAPCIVQFPHLKDTYEQYKDKGFEIVGISTDREKYKQNWQKAIEKYQLPWPQYWDRNGKESSKLSINKFPTNYLLDSEGKIIKKDLRPVELDQFLQENI